jgi:pilus assembly protein Flp/PilA
MSVINFVRFIKSDKGVTLIEYAVIASLIALVVVGALASIGGTLTGFFQSVLNGFP